jgi:hypothetical protein
MEALGELTLQNEVQEDGTQVKALQKECQQMPLFQKMKF